MTSFCELPKLECPDGCRLIADSRRTYFGNFIICHRGGELKFTILLQTMGDVAEIEYVPRPEEQLQETIENLCFGLRSAALAVAIADAEERRGRGTHILH